MLYYILPPIIIILSFSVLIFFLFRKVSSLPEGAVKIKESEPIQWSKFNEFFAQLGHFGLKFLERLMQKIKLFSLKFHNTSNDWFHSIKKKREEHRVSYEQKKQIELAQRAERALAEKEKQKEERMMIAEDEETVIAENEIEESAPIIRRSSPRRLAEYEMVSEKVTRPERKAVATKAKDKLEDALIKRIAVNPKDIEAYERLGDYYIEQQNTADALECYRQVLRLSPVHYKAKMKIRKLEKVSGRKI